jgi:diketogulonate reductase-like aldo/keto reductase
MAPIASNLNINSRLAFETSSNEIPQIGFGVYLSPPETCVASCKKAFEAGYRHIDTAQYYENEAQVGKALTESGLSRKDVYITSKILFAGDDLDSTYQKIVDSVEKLAGKDGYVDLFLIHSPNFGPEKRKLMWQAQEKAQDAGKVRDIGVSNYGIQHIEEIKSFGKVWPPVVNQIEVCISSVHNGMYVTDRRSYTLGANNARLSSTARRTTSSLKLIALSFAMRSRKIRL